MIDPDRALARLREPSDPALRDLARLVVEHTTATPITDIAAPRWIASQLAATLEAGTRTTAFRDAVVKRVAEERERWKGDSRKLREIVPTDAVKPVRDMLRRAYVPSEDLAVRVLDQDAMRNMVREVLVDVLQRFRAKVSVGGGGDGGGMFGGLGARAAKRGRGFLGGIGENLGGVAHVAEGIVGAVKEEVEFALDGKVKDFARNATSDVIRLVARDLSNADRAGNFAEMRVAVLDVLLNTRLSELAEEAGKLEPESVVDSLIVAARQAVSAPGFVDETEARISAVLAEAGDGTLGAWLDEVDLRAVWTDATTELVESRIRATVATPAFAAWWLGLFAGV